MSLTGTHYYDRIFSMKKEEKITFRLATLLLSKLKERASGIPISVVLRRLIEKYIKGEIGLD